MAPFSDEANEAHMVGMTCSNQNSLMAEATTPTSRAGRRLRLRELSNSPKKVVEQAVIRDRDNNEITGVVVEKGEVRRRAWGKSIPGKQAFQDVA